MSMTTPAPTPDTPRPERILPTEPGDWRVRVAGGRPCIVAVVAAHYPVPELRRPLRDPEEGTLIVPDHDGDEVTWGGFDWLHAIPTPEQLAAQAAQLAAGQALADAERAFDETKNWGDDDGDEGREWTPEQKEEFNRLMESSMARYREFLAAFPAGGAR